LNFKKNELNYLNKKLIRKLLGVKSTILKMILFQYCSKTYVKIYKNDWNLYFFT